jgi:hypothetical protein
MKNLKKPQEEETLFNLEGSTWWRQQLSANALRRLEEGWQGVFQRTILKLLGKPAEALGEAFDEELGLAEQGALCDERVAVDRGV